MRAWRGEGEGEGKRGERLLERKRHEAILDGVGQVDAEDLDLKVPHDLRWR